MTDKQQKKLRLAIEEQAPAEIEAISPSPEVFLASEFYTTVELMAKLKISRKTVFNWSRDGHMPPPIPFKSGLRWRGADLKTWVDGGAGRWDGIGKAG